MKLKTKLKLAMHIMRHGGFPMESKKCEVRIIGDVDVRYMNEALGITDERNKFLVDEVHRLSISEKDVATVLYKISLTCTHPNELALVSFVLGKKSATINPLTQIMGGLFGGR